jgi:adenylate kinase family enzyme
MGYTAEMLNIGRRVVVYGTTGSGKTTVAARIAQCLGVPHIELDAIFWLPDWTQKPPEEYKTEVVALLERYRDGWVCDGNYRELREITLPQADTVVWLWLPFRVIYWRLLKRTIRRAWKKESLWGTNRESLLKAFFSRDSLLLYAITSRRRHRRNISRDLNEVSHQAEVYELRSAREVEAFLASLSSQGS